MMWHFHKTKLWPQALRPSKLVQLLLFIQLSASQYCDNLTVSRHGQSDPDIPYNHRPTSPSVPSTALFNSEHFDLIYNLSGRFVDFVAAEDHVFAHTFKSAEANDDINDDANGTATTFTGGILRDIGEALEWRYLTDNAERLRNHFLTYKLATTSLITFSLVLILLFPTFGFFFCVCRCCCGGRCGGKSEPMDKRWDNCRRFFYTLFTLAFVMGMLLAIVACFAMTVIFIQGLEDSSGGIEREVHKLRTTRRNMVSRIDRGVVKEFAKATDRISTTIANAGSFVGEEVNKLSGIRSFLIKGLSLTIWSSDIRDQISLLQNISSELRETDVVVVVDSLRSIFESNECVEEGRDRICQRINETLLFFADLETVVNSFPEELGGVGKDIDRILFQEGERNLTGSLIEAVEKYNHIQTRVREAINKTEFEITEALMEGKQHVGKEICMFTGRMKNYFNVVRMRKKAKNYLEMYEDLKVKHGGIKAIRLTLLCLGSFCALITLLLGLGMLHVCGSRPGLGRSCSRGTGACCLMTAISLFILLGWILIVVVIAMFALGSQLDTEVCGPLSDPYSFPNSSLEMFVKEMNVFSSRVNELSFSTTVSKCQFNKTVYSILKDTRLFDEDYAQFESQITTDKVYPFLGEILEEFSESAIAQVRALTPDFFTKNIQDSFTKLAELNLTRSLPILEDYFPPRPWNDSSILVAEIGADAENVEIKKDVDVFVEEMVGSVNLKNLKKTLDKASSYFVKAGKTSLARQYHTLKQRVEQMEAENYIDEQFRPLLARFSFAIAELNRAVDFESQVAVMAFNATSSSDNLHTTWKQVVQNAIMKYISDLQAVVRAELASLLRALESRIGHCGPIWRLFTNLGTIGCDQILIPFNGFWFCLGWFLIFAFFAISFAIKLVYLFRKKNSFDADASANPSFDNRRNLDARHRRQNRSKDHFYGYSPGQAEHMPLTMDHSGNYHRQPSNLHHHHHQSHRFSRGSSIVSGGGGPGGRGPDCGPPPMGRGMSDYFISEYPPHLRPNHPAQRMASTSSPDDLPPPPYPDYPPPPDVDHYPPHDADPAARRRQGRGRESAGGAGGSGGQSGGANPPAPPPYCLPGGGLDEPAAPSAVMGESVDEGWMMDDEWTVDSPKSPMRMP